MRSKAKEVNLGGKKVRNLALESDQNELSEVVLIG